MTRYSPTANPAAWPPLLLPSMGPWEEEEEEEEGMLCPSACPGHPSSASSQPTWVVQSWFGVWVCGYVHLLFSI